MQRIQEPFAAATGAAARRAGKGTSVTITRSREKQFAIDYLDEDRDRISAFHKEIWDYHEPAWREFQDAVLDFTGLARRDPRADAGNAARDEVLTARERAVLAQLCEGRSNAQIGWQLGIAEKTVRNHVSALYRKLGVRSRAEAIVKVAGRRP